MNGSNTIRTSHVPPIGRVVLGVQSFAAPVSCVKFVGSLITTPPIGTASLPELVMVATCGALGPALTSAVKLSASGERLSCARMPVPFRST